MINNKPSQADAYRLVHEGVLAFSRAEQQGIRIDLEYCQETQKRLTQQIKEIENRFHQTTFYKQWNKATKGKPNINSNSQLGWYLYKVKKLTPTKTTVTGQGSTDEEALESLGIPEIQDLLQMRKLKKIRDTYLKGFMKEQVDGYIHPNFNLHIARTYRSCVAKGSKVLVVRDFEKHPDGVPIEQVKQGDYVYCFDNDLNPAIRKVLWAGKTGHKEVVRIHWVAKGGRGSGYLDVTPEHLIRLIDGSYEHARNLDPKENDYRKETDSKRLAKVRTLSCCRVGDTLRFTGHLRHGNGLLEHRLIYKHFHGPLKDTEVVHHKNENHYDHVPGNLQKMTLSNHSRHHALTRPEDVKQRSIQALLDNRHKVKPLKGKEHPHYIGLTKYQCLKELARVGGKLTKVNYDFETFKNYLKKYNIDPQIIRRRYNYFGEYFSKGKLKKLEPLGRAKVREKTRLSFYHLKELYEQYGMNSKSRKWGNQFGEFTPGNHIITEVEWIGKTVDVYDIEVEDYHNFFANEICVHNSSSNPNFQNIPKRDKEAAEICRSALYPRPGHQLLEVDYSSIEVCISACYHKDPTMIKYIENPDSDMHGDMAEQIFFLDKLDKSIPGHKTLRSAAKNGFVFPQFYGDYYGNNAPALACEWGKLPEKGKWKKGQGIEIEPGLFLSDHLIKNSIYSLGMFTDHLQRIEEHFWNTRFRAYNKWKERWWQQYQKDGYIDMLTGFRCWGPMARNDATNYPIQGTAFHCLLWSFIRLDKVLRAKKLKTRLVGQIHDAIVLDVHPKELEQVSYLLQKIMIDELRKHWDWIIVPLAIEMDLGGVDESWNELKPYNIK